MLSQHSLNPKNKNETMSLLVVFFQQTEAVSGKKFFQVVDLRNQFLSLVSVFHHQSLAVEFNEERIRLDVESFLNRLLP